MVGEASSASTALRLGRLPRALLVALVLLAWFSTLELRGLFIPDEARYAEIPREMVASGDWVTPRLNDLKYFEKPPLQYWLTAASFKAFGPDEWTARLPSALLGFLALLMVTWTGRRLWSPRAGVLAALVCSSSWGFYLSSQYLTLDMALTGCLTFALCFLLLWQAEDDRRWLYCCYAAAGFSVLAKGLVGLVIPALAVIAYGAITGNVRLALRSLSLRGMALMLGIAAPWFLLVQRANPEFLHFFFVEEHFNRYLRPEHHRAGPWWYYVPILLLGMLPWTPALLYRLPAAWKALGSPRTRDALSPALFCCVWAACVVVFFSESSSKLPAYVVPCFPAFALVLGHSLRHLDPQPLRVAADWGVALGLLLALLVAWIPSWGKFSAIGPDAADARPWLFAAAGCVLLGSLAAAWAARNHFARSSVAALMLGTFGMWSCAFAFLHEVDDYFSTERLIESVTGERNPPFHPDVPFYSILKFDHSVPFYLERPVTLVGFKDELAPGIQAEPRKYLSSVEAFESLWRGRVDGYAIMTPAQFRVFADERLPMRPLAKDARYVIVSRDVDDR